MFEPEMQSHFHNLILTALKKIKSNTKLLHLKFLFLMTAVLVNQADQLRAQITIKGDWKGEGAAGED